MVKSRCCARYYSTTSNALVSPKDPEYTIQSDSISIHEVLNIHFQGSKNNVCPSFVRPRTSIRLSSHSGDLEALVRRVSPTQFFRPPRLDFKAGSLVSIWQRRSEADGHWSYSFKMTEVPSLFQTLPNRGSFLASHSAIEFLYERLLLTLSLAYHMSPLTISVCNMLHPTFLLTSIPAPHPHIPPSTIPGHYCTTQPFDQELLLVDGALQCRW